MNRESTTSLGLQTHESRVESAFQKAIWNGDKSLRHTSTLSIELNDVNSARASITTKVTRIDDSHINDELQSPYDNKDGNISSASPIPTNKSISDSQPTEITPTTLKTKDMNSNVSPLARSVWTDENDLPQFFDEKNINSKRISTVDKFSELIPSDALKNGNSWRSRLTAFREFCTICSTWQRTLAFFLTLIILCAAAIVLPIVLTNALSADHTLPPASVTTTTTSSTITTTTTTTSTTVTTTTTTSTTTTTTTTTTVTTTTTTTTTTTGLCTAGCVNVSSSTVSRIAFYGFESNSNDATGAYNAGGMSSPAYTTGYVGTAMSFNAGLGQRLSAAHMPLDSRSFTIEFWFTLVNGAVNNYAFFGELAIASTTRQSLFVVALGGRLCLGYFNDDTVSSTVLQDNTWYHAAFVYDYSLMIRYIYIDGVLNIQSGSGVGPFLGTSGSVTIGGADIYGGYGIPYFTGLLDHLTVSLRVKSSCEILNDATLAAYFPFDGSFTDGGPNFLGIISSGAILTNGVVHQAMYLSGSGSYMQIGSLTGLGRTNYPFSFALWIYWISGAVIAHVSAISTGLGWCTPFMGIDSNSNIIVQVHRSAGPYVMVGPVIQNSTWTHIVHTYSPTNGQKLYVNGVLFSQLPGATIYTASGSQNFVTIGSVLSGTACYNPGFGTVPFRGMIDELRIYSRELSANDVCILAWP